MSNLLKIPIICLLHLLVFTSFSYALSVDSVTVDKASPGEEGIIRIDVENDGNKDINYEEDGDERKQSGTIGIIVSAEPELEIVAEIQNPVIGQTGKLNIKIVNKGLADARFVSLSIESEDITILSEKSEYVGTIESDDFESASFDVAYNKKLSTILVKLKYKDFDNNEQTISENIALRIYTKEEAIEKGILKKSNATLYIAVVLVISLGGGLKSAILSQFGISSTEVIEVQA